MNDASVRLGVNGVNEIKGHPFFSGIDWKRLHDRIAPYKPEVKSDIDTRNFDKFEEQETWVPTEYFKIIKNNLFMKLIQRSTTQRC